jgi:uncharacterized repeat protein (TIGR01451 family)
VILIAICASKLSWSCCPNVLILIAMKSFLSSLCKLETSVQRQYEPVSTAGQTQLLNSWFKKSRVTDRLIQKRAYGISISLYTSLLAIGTSIGVGITFNPQRGWAGSCVGTYSSRSGVTINAAGQVVVSATSSVIGYFNNISNSYVPLVNYTGGNNINALATQPLTGNLYFVNRTTGKVIVFNVNTNVQSPLSGSIPISLSTGTSIIGATFNASGKLYVYYSDKKLIEVDPTSGAQIGATINISGIPGGGPPPPGTIADGATLTGGTTNGDIAISPNGSIYILGDTSVTNSGGILSYTSRLYTITISGTTATAVPVVASNIAGLGGAAANGLAIDPASGNFYISSNLGTYELDPIANTAVQLTNATGTNDLASCGLPAPDLPTITKAFSPNNIVGVPATSTLTLTLGNSNTVPIYAIQTLTDTFPTGLTVNNPNSLGGTCTTDVANASKITAVAGSNTLSIIDGLKIPAGGCTITINVRTSTTGTFTNTIAAGALKTTAGDNLNATTDTLTTTPAPNFGLCPALAYITQGVNANSVKLNSVDLLTGVLSPISASNFPAGVNAIGFNQLDGYIYGIKSNSGNVVIRIDANGVGYELGAIPGLPLADYNAGDVTANGILYVKPATGTTAYGIDLNPTSPTYLTIVKTITGLISLSDFAFHPTNGKLYTIQDATGKVYEISWPAAGATVAATLVDRGKPTNLPIGTYGAIYFASDGSLYGYSNGTAGSNNGAIYRMTNVVGTGLPVATALTTTATGVSFNDGARCPLAPPIVPPTTAADVKLIKRITAINGDRVKNPNDPTKPLNQVLDNPATANDNAGVNWPNTSSFSLLGAYQPGLIKPDDVIEYTIYFLNASGADANAVKICDRIVGSQQFVADAYGPGQDIEYKLGANATQYLTGASLAGIDRAELNSSTAAIAGCPSPTIVGTNNGTVAIDVTGAGSTGQIDLLTLPGATAPGVPTNSYGYFRFKVKVNP